jgi:hypothetical protein
MSEIKTDTTLYDINKQCMNQFEEMDKKKIKENLEIIAKDLLNKAVMEEKIYWMLLNNERKDYTVFIPSTVDGMIQALEETLSNRGKILDIQKQEDGAYEIWIRDLYLKDNYVYYLFNYTNGIVCA